MLDAGRGVGGRRQDGHVSEPSPQPPTPPGFSTATQAWFEGAFAAATPAQVGAWQSIRAGRHTLVVAPTGSGKTLAAFLSALDQLASEPVPSDPLRRCRVVYVSPLKALAVDVERNLRSPLAGIRQAAQRLQLPPPDITVAMRSGDTSADERRLFARRPADILITTPESLFLLLTANAREALRGVQTVIIDEVHSVCSTKRGAHLALSLERLDALLDQPAQRIGLSATVRPVGEVATFLGGSQPVEVVAPPVAKTFDLDVVVPVEDMSQLGEPNGDLSGAAAGAERRASIWPHVEERVLDLIEQHRSTIVFANSRRLAERLTARLNELAVERLDPPVPHLLDAETMPGRAPAQLMGGSGKGGAAAAVVARAHHGSVSREQRAIVEEELKAGRLPAVVATSSLELGIDMGAVDLVVQVEAPPSVASGLQRVGRAGHQVGAVSHGVIFPKYRGDLVECAVVAERMRAGQIESMRYPRNPLDVLAQQIVGIVAMEPITVDELDRLVQRAAPFAGLPRSALEAVLDMLAGRYPSDAFAELRPRLVWDRLTGELTARGGAQRLAVTSGGTIPDRGLFGVFMAGAEGTARRVGELDEEMVYESRVGDVFLLGSSSWRIEDITHDRVLVSPAPGEIGRMPFWKGDAPGRPVELGRALGAFLREVSHTTPEQALDRARRAGLDDGGAANLQSYLVEQREATGRVPDDRSLVVERFRDELGDWRLVVHSPFGAPVNAPWALAITARLRERYGLAAQSMHSDDGIVVRLPDTDAEPPSADLVAFDAEEISRIVTEEVGGSALFASRFRECAARALLLPRRDPRRRTALWQQRQRANQLLQVASEYSDFPIVLEAMRECLQDVFDLPGLTQIMRDIDARTIRLIDIETPTASPFARSLLFGYVGMFLYEADAPLAERRAQALSLDPAMLAELLGSTELRDLLDTDSIDSVEQELQRLAPDRRAHGIDGVHDLLRGVGDLSTAEALARGATPAELADLEATRRVIRVRVAGEQRWCAIEDAGRMRDALGTALPIGVPEAFTEPVADPLGDLVSRYARTHGPFHADDLAARLGLGAAVVMHALERLRAGGRVLTGEFRPGRQGSEWCDREVLRLIRRRSLAALRKEVEAVDHRTLARFRPAWQNIGVRSSPLRGVDGVLRAVEQLAGAPLAASALETLILPMRVADYVPAMLDELTLAGDVVWAGAGSLGAADGWLVLAPTEAADLLLPEIVTPELSNIHLALMSDLDGAQALFFRALVDSARMREALTQTVTTVTDEQVSQAMWDLVWAGWLTNDTLAPVRALLDGPTRAAHPRRPRTPRARYGRYSGLVARRDNPAPGRSGRAMSGRWSRVPARSDDATLRAVAAAEALLDRYGVLTRADVVAERLPGGFSTVYPVLKAAEESGRTRRGYFVDGLGAAQFALPGAVDRLRAAQMEVEQAAVAQPASGNAAATMVLAATDPGNPYGASLAWPNPGSNPALLLEEGEQATEGGKARRGHQPTRKAGALVVLVDGACVLYVERGGRSLLSFADDPAVLQPAADALALAVHDGLLGRLSVERADGAPIGASALGAALEAAGFRPTPRGLRLRR
ncbi:MAG: ATP-dependent helicase [Actinobacteria bacterium]|nr:ATP-dependent helicase [Actinomycetota bacterium]